MTSICEKLLGFIPLKKIDTTTIADAFNKHTKKFGLKLDKLYSQGYEGYLGMAGKDNDVKVCLKNIYQNVTFVHCFLNCLNLVDHNLNSAACEKNTTGTEKSISFFQDSPKCRDSV